MKKSFYTFFPTSSALHQLFMYSSFTNKKVDMTVEYVIVSQLMEANIYTPVGTLRGMRASEVPEVKCTLSACHFIPDWFSIPTAILRLTLPIASKIVVRTLMLSFAPSIIVPATAKKKNLKKRRKALAIK